MVKSILSSFTSKCKENPLLPLEIIFPFPNRETKEQILTNYEYRTFAQEAESDYENQEMEEENEFEISDLKKRFENNGWTEDDDKKLLEYYSIFNDDMGTCVSKLSKIMNKYPEAIEERLKQKGLQYKQTAQKEKKIDLESAFKGDEKGDGLKRCKESIKGFIRNGLGKGEPHEKILEWLGIFEEIVER